VPADYIPGDDPGFDAFQSAFRIYVNANLANLGLVALDTDVAAMNTYEAVLRRLAQRLQESGSVDDTELAAMGLTVRDTTPSPIADPTSRPVGSADTSQRLRIGLTWTDEATPTSRAKPFGVVGCNVFLKLDGPPPGDLSECEFIGFSTRTPFVEEFEAGDANKTAHFILQWVGTRGGVGPISETISATVPG
jgi:hypothetical protein